MTPSSSSTSPGLTCAAAPTHCGAARLPFAGMGVISRFLSASAPLPHPAVAASKGKAPPPPPPAPEAAAPVPQDIPAYFQPPSAQQVGQHKLMASQRGSHSSGHPCRPSPCLAAASAVPRSRACSTLLPFFFPPSAAGAARPGVPGCAAVRSPARRPRPNLLLGRHPANRLRRHRWEPLGAAALRCAVLCRVPRSQGWMRHKEGRTLHCDWFGREARLLHSRTRVERVTDRHGCTLWWVQAWCWPRCWAR
jgi:hypothetical protein